MKNRAQLSLFIICNIQLAIILFNRTTWPVYIYVHVYIYGFPVMWIKFPKHWTECCSPSSFLSRNPLNSEDHVVNNVHQNMGFDDSNHILLCFMKTCITWHSWATNKKLTFSWKITLQGAISPFSWTLRKKLQWNLYWNLCIFIQEKVLSRIWWPFCLGLNMNSVIWLQDNICEWVITVRPDLPWETK